MYKREVHDPFIDIRDDKNNIVFTLKEELAGGRLLIGVAGAIQTDAVYEFEDEVLAALSVCGGVGAFTQLVFDLSRIGYISSAALSSFLKFQGIVDAHDGMQMIILQPSEPVMRRLEETGFVDMLDIRNADAAPEE